MKHSIRKSIAVAALVAASAIALPTAASAATIYPDALACSASPTTLAPGATTTFSCDDETFAPGETITITIEGATSADIGFVKFATTSSGSATATSTGALAGLSVTFPSNASGVYNITASSEGSAGGTASVTVTTTGSGSGGGTLPSTGIDSSSLLGLWVGGGALILVGGSLAVATTVRRNRKQSAGI
ncbi:LPXTG cell wall anchor domain-containing protein [Microbacterium sp. P5_E9]